MEKVKLKVHHVKRKLSRDESNLHSNGRFVLVTGGYGFVTTWIIKQFLSNGYRVRTTVKSNAEAQDVRDTFSQYAHNLETPVLRYGPHDEEVVKGVDGIICTGLDHWRRVFEAVVKCGEEVRRVVLTSSLEGVVDSGESGRVYTEGDFNLSSEEATAHAFMREKQPSFTLATICPSMVWGPIAHKTDIDTIRSCPQAGGIWNLLEGKGTTEFKFPAFVDVRNVAQAHLRAYERRHDEHVNEYQEERYIVSSGSVTQVQVCTTLRHLFPLRKFHVPDPASIGHEETAYEIDHTKTVEELSTTFIGLEDCLRDMGESLMEVEEASKKGLRYDGQEWFRHI